MVNHFRKFSNIDSGLILCFFFVHREKNGTDVSLVPSLKGRYEIHDKENNFIIRDTTPDDDGTYTCSIPEVGSATIEVIGK